jgi:hypothetical protein
MHKNVNGRNLFGWESLFLIPISGTPIESGIPALVPILCILVFFFNSTAEKSSNRNSDMQFF